jgi:hypothetical protein
MLVAGNSPRDKLLRDNDNEKATLGFWTPILTTVTR